MTRKLCRTIVTSALALAAVVAAGSGCGCTNRDAVRGRPQSPARVSSRSVDPRRPSPRKKTFLAAAIQAVSKLGRPADNRKHLEKLIRRAARRGAKVIVLPETAITGYLSQDLTTAWQVGGRKVTAGLTGLSPARVAERVPGPSTRAWSRLSAELGVYLTVPILEVNASRTKYYNTLVLTGPDGRVLSHYRKRNPWPFAERGWAEPGDRGNVYVDTPLGRMGLLICYDINFEPPNLKRMGIDHLLHAIAWVDDPGSDWFVKGLPAVARRNRLNIIGANWTVPASSRPKWHGYGQSVIIDREGRLLAKAPRDRAELIIYARLPVR